MIDCIKSRPFLAGRSGVSRIKCFCYEFCDSQFAEGGFLRLLNLFKRKPTGSTEANQRWIRGYEAFEAGKKHFAAGRDKDAVDCFDTAVECGFEEVGGFAVL